jgi:hypothetical protein
VTDILRNTGKEDVNPLLNDSAETDTSGRNKYFCSDYRLLMPGGEATTTSVSIPLRYMPSQCYHGNDQNLQTACPATRRDSDIV